MSNVRISESTHAALRSLAAEGGESTQSVPDKAIKEYRRRLLWERVEQVALDLRADSAAWEDEISERRAWDATLADGLEDQ